MWTENWQLHRNEQMEAVRRDFFAKWESELKPLLVNCNVHHRASEADFAFIQMVCWKCYLTGL